MQTAVNSIPVYKTNAECVTDISKLFCSSKQCFITKDAQLKP